LTVYTEHPLEHVSDNHAKQGGFFAGGEKGVAAKDFIKAVSVEWCKMLRNKSCLSVGLESRKDAHTAQRGGQKDGGAWVSEGYQMYESFISVLLHCN